MSRPAGERAKRHIALSAVVLLIVVLPALQDARPEEEQGQSESAPNAGAKKAAVKDARGVSPLGLDLTETAGVTLTLLDVEVRDRKGRPVPGLRKEDFRLQLGAKEWPIYSVDDLCSCEDAEGLWTPPDQPGRPQVVEKGTEAGAGAGTEGEGRRTKEHSAKERPAQEHPAKEHPAEERTAEERPVKEHPTKERPAETRAVNERPADRTVGDRAVEDRAAAGRTSEGREPRARDESRAPDDPLRFVLFFDFGQLQQAGRAIALRDARRWIREVKRPDDEAMIAGYTEQAGLAEICSFTSDAARLLTALDTAERDPALQDPFPSMIHLRADECERAQETCDGHAREEYAHARHSLMGLRVLLSNLDPVPGRKELIDFQENGIVFPGRIYHVEGSDTTQLLEEVGAAANLSRTSIHAAYVGDRLGAGTAWEKQLTDGAVNLGSQLADFTGGTYSLDRNAVSSLTSAVRGGCACIYRLGFEPPPKPTDRIYHAQVQVRGRILPHSYRVAFLDDVDRWLIRATAVLMNPERAKALRIGAAVVPVRAANGRWDVAVAVALDLDAIEAIPGVDGSRGSWETGALFASDSGSEQWELMGVSGFRRPEGGRGGGGAHDGAAQEQVVLHERLMENLESGRFTLRAFVRDRVAGVFGGAEAVLELPRARSDAVAGPVLLRPDRRHLLAPLPVFKKKDAIEAHVTGARTGEIPLWGERVASGEKVVAVTWLCPRRVVSWGPAGATERSQRSPAERLQQNVAAARAESSLGSMTRYVALDRKPVFRLEEPRLESAGDCVRMTDLLETGELAPGEYAYVLEWKAAEDSKPVRVEAHFSIVAPAAAAVGEPLDGDSGP